MSFGFLSLGKLGIAPGAGGGVPENTVLPGTPTGTAQIGETLTSPDTGTWTGSPSLSRQWFRADPTFSGGSLVTSGGDIVYTNSADISGQTGATYVLAAADANKVVGVKVTDSVSVTTVASFVVGTVFDAAAATYFASASSINDQDQTYFNTFILALKTASCFADFEGLYFHGVGTQADAIVDMSGNGNDITISGTPTFTAGQGFTGDGSAYLDTGYNAATGGGLFTVDNAFLLVYTLGATNNDGALAGVYDAGDTARFQPRMSSGVARGRINVNTGNSDVAGAAGAGLAIILRDSSSNQSIIESDGTKTDFAVSSTGLGNGNVTFLGARYSKSSGVPLLASAFGRNMTASRWTAINNAFTALKSSLGIS